MIPPQVDLTTHLPDYKQLCIGMLAAWDIACCPVLPSDPGAVFERARKLLSQNVWLSIGTYSGDNADAFSAPEVNAMTNDLSTTAC